MYAPSNGNVSFPGATIPFSLTVVPDTGDPPSTPSISSGGQCVVGTPFTITMTATDSDGDDIRYGIDLDANGVLDQFVPATGYVPSGTPQTTSRTYATPGVKTVKIMAEDEGGLSSGWATFTFTCSDAPVTPQPPQPPPPPPSPTDPSCPAGAICLPPDGGICPLGYVLQDDICVFTNCPVGYAFNIDTGLCEEIIQCIPQALCGTIAEGTANSVINSCTREPTEDCSNRGADWFCSGGQCILILPDPDSGDGELRVDPARIRSGDTTRVIWNASTSFDECRVTEDNNSISDSWTDFSGNEESSPIDRRTKYSLRCDGQLIDTATVNITPKFIEK
jgi:hypothetical protein